MITLFKTNDLGQGNHSIPAPTTKYDRQSLSLSNRPYFNPAAIYKHFNQRTARIDVEVQQMMAALSGRGRGAGSVIGIFSIIA
jgi:hypothetical protein